MKSFRAAISISLPFDLVVRLRDIGEKKGLNISKVVEQLLIKALEAEKEG